MQKNELLGGIDNHAALAIIAEILGFTGVAGEATWIAHVLFVIAIIFIIISFVTGRGGPPAV